MTNPRFPIGEFKRPERLSGADRAAAMLAMYAWHGDHHIAHINLARANTAKRQRRTEKLRAAS